MRSLLGRRHGEGNDIAPRRVVVLLAAVLCFVLVSEQPAAAHGAGGIEATNFETTIDGITPALPGVSVKVIESGARLELRNDGPEVVVLGNDREPYLRVGADGAFENRQSPTADLNRQQLHDPQATGSGNPNAPPEWRKLSDKPVVRWHQHSTHWMAPRNPPEVEANPGQRHVVIPRWEIQLQRGGDPAVAFGNLTWVPGPSPAPWFGFMAATFLVVGGLGLLRRWGRPLAAVTAIVLAADVIHALSVAFAFSGGFGTHLAKLVTGSFYAFIGWGSAALAFRFLRRGKVDGLYAGVFAGLSIAVFGGLLDLAKLSRSISLSVLPTGAARLFVALSAGGGLGLAAACLVAIQRTPDARGALGVAADDDDTPRAEDPGEAHGQPG